MAFFTLEIVTFSAEKLSLDKKPVKRNTFVVVKTDPFNSKSTKADFEGGSSPSWNEKLVMVMPMHARFITLQVLCRVGSVDRVIGTVDVPASDFLGKYCSAPESYEHILSYRLKNEKGEKNGIVNLSIKVSDQGSPAPVTRNNKSVGNTCYSQSFMSITAISSGRLTAQRINQLETKVLTMTEVINKLQNDIAQLQGRLTDSDIHSYSPGQ